MYGEMEDLPACDSFRMGQLCERSRRSKNGPKLRGRCSNTDEGEEAPPMQMDLEAITIIMTWKWFESAWVHSERPFI